ncbi:MAG: (d)CMP kinase [Planctomycetes bacterium]|nr:(d)CMP kinase [Planctomycetota bacterium]
MSQSIITIDGPAGVGKSTVARMLAHELGAVFLDTGATYRALTLAAMRAGADLKNTRAILDVMKQTTFDYVHQDDVLKVLINGQDATQQIREPDVTENVKHIASQPELRAELVRLQKAFAGQFEKVVTEGRDQGTVVFPDAAFKFFLIADPQERARRRYDELKAAGKEVDLETLTRQIVERDASDQNRTISPLKPADDAVIIDTTTLDVEDVVNKMLEVIERQHD